MSRFGKILIVALILLGCSFFVFFASLFGLAASFSNTDFKASLVENKEPFVAFIRVDGPILNSEEMTETIWKLKENNNCKGILLRIESPGGAVASSQEVYTALRNFATKERPVIASMGNLAASGGYYIACGAQKIFASPGTATGSIGVIFQFPEVDELMKKVGVQMTTIKSGKLKDVGSPFGSTSAEEKDYLQNVIGDTYEQFLQDVANGRGLEKEGLREIADGRIFTGRQALQLGLVDSLGGLEEAKRFIIQLCDLKLEDLHEAKKTPSLMERLSEISTRLNPAALLSQDLFRRGFFFIWP